MKKLFIITWVICTIFVLHSLEGDLLDDIVESRIQEKEVTEDTRQILSEQIIKEIIPFKFQEVLIEETKHSYEMRILAMSIGFVESGWVHMRSFKPNKDGSIDLGPMALNSNNIKNDYFMEKYANLKYDYDTDIFYMVACIRYMEDLVSKHPDNFLKVYNTGILNVRRGTIPESTYKYEELVFKYREKFHEYTLNDESYNILRNTIRDKYKQEISNSLFLAYMKYLKLSKYARENNYHEPEKEFHKVFIDTNYKEDEWILLLKYPHLITDLFHYKLIDGVSIPAIVREYIAGLFPDRYCYIDRSIEYI